MLTFEAMSLKAAGNAVKRASDNLVRAAQKAAFDKSEDDSVVVKTKFVGGIAQVRQKNKKSGKNKIMMCELEAEISSVLPFALFTVGLRILLICQNAKCCFSARVMSCCG